MKKINKVTVRRLYDEDPDTSYIGIYTDEYNPAYIDRQAGDFIFNLVKPVVDCETCNRITTEEKQPTQCADHEYQLPSNSREYRYFKPYAGGEKPDTPDYGTYGLQDYERMKGLCEGNWNFIGIKAEAECLSGQNGKEWKIDRLSSGGLWGIESDSGREYLEEVEKEELVNLKTVLLEYGFSRHQIYRAFKKVERKES